MRLYKEREYTFIFDKRGDAEAVLECLDDLIHQYGEATVGDLFDICGLIGIEEDDQYGWVDLDPSAAYVKRVKGGYQTYLPVPMYLGNKRPVKSNTVINIHINSNASRTVNIVID